MRDYFRDIYMTVKTILTGMRITLKYCFARTVTLQYPNMAPVLQPRFRGMHWFEAEKCIACDQCARACPVDCIYIHKTAPRKIDKATGVATGGALTRFAIDYAKCMFCALCCEPCPTECIHMGNVHAMAGYDRESMLVEFTELARQGLQTPQPLWAQKDRLPDWAVRQRQEWLDRAAPAREKMALALTEQLPPRKPDAPAAAAAPEAKP